MKINDPSACSCRQVGTHFECKLQKPPRSVVYASFRVDNEIKNKKRERERELNRVQREPEDFFDLLMAFRSSHAVINVFISTAILARFISLKYELESSWNGSGKVESIDIDEDNLLLSGLEERLKDVFQRFIGILVYDWEIYWTILQMYGEYIRRTDLYD